MSAKITNYCGYGIYISKLGYPDLHILSSSYINLSISMYDGCSMFYSDGTRIGNWKGDDGETQLLVLSTKGYYSVYPESISPYLDYSYTSIDGGYYKPLTQDYSNNFKLITGIKSDSNHTESNMGWEERVQTVTNNYGYDVYISSLNYPNLQIPSGYTVKINIYMYGTGSVLYHSDGTFLSGWGPPSNKQTELWVLSDGESYSVYSKDIYPHTENSYVSTGGKTTKLSQSYAGKFSNVWGIKSDKVYTKEEMKSPISTNSNKKNTVTLTNNCGYDVYIYSPNRSNLIISSGSTVEVNVDNYNAQDIYYYNDKYSNKTYTGVWFFNSDYKSQLLVFSTGDSYWSDSKNIGSYLDSSYVATLGKTKQLSQDYANIFGTIVGIKSNDIDHTKELMSSPEEKTEENKEDNKNEKNKPKLNPIKSMSSIIIPMLFIIMVSIVVAICFVYRKEIMENFSSNK
jgi:hypothetical protein